MDPIAKTAYYCCGVRMLDARSRNPVCNDHLAERFMDQEALSLFRPFERFRGPNASNAARHRLIDDLLRQRLAANPALRILLLGAGLDTRAFRLQGGQWLEIDQPALIALKERVLPASDAPNPLQRISIDFARESIRDKLAPRCDPSAETVVVMEGVSMYLEAAQLADTTRALRALLGRHSLYCDLMTKSFAQRYGKGLRAEIAALGGNFAELMDEPAAFMTAQGYRHLRQTSIPGRAVEHGSVKIPRWLFNTLLRSLRDGYRLHEFETE